MSAELTKSSKRVRVEITCAIPSDFVIHTYLLSEAIDYRFMHCGPFRLAKRIWG